MYVPVVFLKGFVKLRFQRFEVVVYAQSYDHRAGGLLGQIQPTVGLQIRAAEIVRIILFAFIKTNNVVGFAEQLRRELCYAQKLYYSSVVVNSSGTGVGLSFENGPAQSESP